MVRITRRDFLKYCSVAAGALGLSASTLMKVDKVLAANGAADVVWLAGAACTGCTMSLLNSKFYTTVDDLLLNRINLAYLDTVMATAGAEIDGEVWTGANSITAARKIYNSSPGFVLVVEGAIPTGDKKDYCKIGDLTGSGQESAYDNVLRFASKDECLAVLCVGTCASFGGIPAARGNVSKAMGFAWTGTTPGGAIVTKGSGGKITNVKVTNGGTAYSSAPTVTASGGGTGSGGATFQAKTDYERIAGFTVALAGTGYTSPVVTVAGGLGATAFARLITPGSPSGIASVHVNLPGSGYTSVPAVSITDPTGTGANVTAIVGTGKVTVVAVTDGGTNFTSVPTIAFSGGGGTGATAVASINAGDVKTKSGLAAKVINIPGCPPHPDWIVGTIAHILDTNITLPPLTNYYRPVDYGYKQYQCNAGPCVWRYNNAENRDDHNARYPVGDSRTLGKFKWGLKPDSGPNAGVTPGVNPMGCLGILGCKGRKTKADCSLRRWNTDEAETYGVNWCVGSRGGCHGCTEPTFPDKVGKFYTFV